MKVPLGFVLVGAAVLVSPAAWMVVSGQSMPLETLMWRFVITVGVCWLVASVVRELVPKPHPPADQPTAEDQTPI